MDYFWYEDPLVEEDLYNYVKLRNKLDIPIMSTEYAPEKPGLGYEIDWELVKRESVQVVK